MPLTDPSIPMKPWRMLQPVGFVLLLGGGRGPSALQEMLCPCHLWASSAEHASFAPRTLLMSHLQHPRHAQNVTLPRLPPPSRLPPLSPGTSIVLKVPEIALSPSPPCPQEPRQPQRLRLSPLMGHRLPASPVSTKFLYVEFPWSRRGSEERNDSFC